MKLGFTGTEKGMSLEQLWKFYYAVEYLMPDEMHHGDCIGADSDAAHICFLLKVKTISHPPIDDKARAFTLSNIVLPPKGYLIRNREIVDSCDMLIATPKEMREQKRSGTWATIRYAKQINRIILIIFPNGSLL